METCIACSMPLMKPDEKGCDTKDGPVCVHCARPEGGIKSCEEIFEGGVAFFLSATGSTDRILAEKLVRKTMNGLSYWQKHPCSCLKGEQASDAEFAAAMAQL